MRHARWIITATAISLFSVVAAKAFDDTAHLNAMRDQTRALERQSRSMEQMQKIESERALREDRAQRNADRDSRSARRFDKH